MHKAMFFRSAGGRLAIATAALAAAGMSLTGATAASAATASAARPVQSSAPAATCLAGAEVGCDTTVTFTVTSGTLSITSPDTAGLSNAPAGGVATGSLGLVTVTDARALLGGGWVASVAGTDWASSVAGADPIPVADGTYDPGTITVATGSGLGTVDTVGSPVTLSATAQAVVTATATVGNNEASWNPVVSVAVPDNAVAGTYTATLTHSVL
jgi:hypothetical protein